MRVLALDTSCPAVTAALVEVSEAGPRLLAESVTVDARRHGELLAGAVRTVLASGRPDAVVVGTGPGPFTGLRVGLMTAAALADAYAIPAYGVCSLDAIAEPGRACVVVTDARRREVYWARYHAGGERIDGPAVDRPIELAERLRVEADPPIVLGDGAAPYREVFAGLEIDDTAPYPRGVLLVRQAVERIRAGAPSDPLTPLYLRRPDAVPSATVKRVTA